MPVVAVAGLKLKFSENEHIYMETQTLTLTQKVNILSAFLDDDTLTFYNTEEKINDYLSNMGVKI